MKVRTKRHICAAVAACAFIMALGIVGGMEHLGVGLGRGLLTSGGFLLLSAGALWKGGWLR